MPNKVYKLYAVIVLIILGLAGYFLYRIIIFDRDRVEELFERGVEDTVVTCVSSASLLSSLFPNRNDYGWTWKCINGKCVRSETLTEIGRDVYKTLGVCQLTCNPYSALWPKPTGKISLSKEVLPFHPDQISFDLSIGETQIKLNSNDLAAQISRRFIEDVTIVCHSECYSICDPQIYIKIITESSTRHLTWETNEAYNLTVSTTDLKLMVTINAENIFGARHALQTLFQLITVLSRNNVKYLFIIKNAFITDKPIYPHRGLLIDTSRHYLKFNTIKRTLDAMGHSKLNVLHWHATDSQSFPLQLPRILELSKYGTYSKEEIYTIQNMKEVIDYAKIRGIRVIMEIDVPGHVENGWQWGELSGLGPLVLPCTQPPCGLLNLANPNIYKILTKVFHDLIDVFPNNEAFHMGGDEVEFHTWNKSAEITDYMKKEGLNTTFFGFLELWANFHNKCVQIIDDIVGNSKTPIILWSSMLTQPSKIQNFLDNQRFIIQTWVDSSDPLTTQLLEKNYKVIISTHDAWYLDHGFSSHTNYSTWRNIYDNSIPDFSKGVLGGEVCMWGEYVDDVIFDSRVWPRAAALAERLWSNPQEYSISATFRFAQHRERLVRIGINAEVVTTEWCYQNENDCF